MRRFAQKNKVSINVVQNSKLVKNTNAPAWPTGNQPVWAVERFLTFMQTISLIPAALHTWAQSAADEHTTDTQLSGRSHEAPPKEMEVMRLRAKKGTIHEEAARTFR